MSPLQSVSPGDCVRSLFAATVHAVRSPRGTEGCGHRKYYARRWDSKPRKPTLAFLTPGARLPVGADAAPARPQTVPSLSSCG